MHDSLRGLGITAISVLLFLGFFFWKVGALGMFVAAVDGVLLRLLPILFIYLLWRLVKALEKR